MYNYQLKVSAKSMIENNIVFFNKKNIQKFMELKFIIRE